MSSLKMLQDLIFETQLSIVQMVPWVILLITHKAPIGLFPTDHIFLFFQELHARFSTVAQSLIISDPPPPKPSTSAITIDYNSSQHKKKISSAVLALLLDNGKLHPEQNMWNQAFLTALNTMSLSRQQGSNMKTAGAYPFLSKIPQSKLLSTCSSVWVGGRAQWLGETQRQYLASAGLRSMNRVLIINPTRSKH